MNEDNVLSMVMLLQLTTSLLTGNSCQKFIVSAVSRNTVSDFEIQHQLDCHGRSFLNLFGLFLEISISDLFSKRLYRKVLSQGKNKALVSCKGTELSFF